MRLVVDLQHMFHRELRVTLRGRQSLVTKQLLNGSQVCAFFEHVRTESVSQRVWMHVRGQALSDGNLLDDAPNAARGEPPTTLVDEQCI